MRAALDQEPASEDGGSWTSQLQAIVDEASRVLGRPLVASDRHRLLAYTRHAEADVDRVRLMALMKQPQSAEVSEWGRRHTTMSSQRPFRFPPNHDLGYEARVVAPIRTQGHHLGLLTCIDQDQTLTDAQLDRMGAFAEQAAAVLYREMLVHDLDRARERELLRDILSDDDMIRREAAWRLADLDLFPSTGRVVVLVISLEEGHDDGSPDSARVAVEATLMRLRRQLAPKHGLHLVRPSHALLLVTLADPSIRAHGVAAYAKRVHGEIVTSLPDRRDGERHIVGVGGIARRLADAPISYDQALRAANAAATVSTFDEVVCWDDLGIYQMLTELPFEAFGAKALHPGIRTLLESSRARDLLPTLELYLDLAGDVQQTAASLYLHRATLYHRLRRIERAANVDLRNGHDRLALHLSLKMARLQGITWPAQAVGDEGGNVTPRSRPPDRDR